LIQNGGILGLDIFILAEPADFGFLLDQLFFGRPERNEIAAVFLSRINRSTGPPEVIFLGFRPFDL
jgi:hypothetical protein